MKKTCIRHALHTVSALVSNDIASPCVLERPHQGHQSKRQIFYTLFLRTKLVALCFCYDIAVVQESPHAEEELLQHGCRVGKPAF